MSARLGAKLLRALVVLSVAALPLVALPAPDDTNDRYDVSLPTVTWAAATGNAISKILVCYDADTGAGTDADIIPLTMFDAAVTPDGSDVQLTGGVFFRAS